MKKRLLAVALAVVSCAVLVRTQSNALSPAAKEWSAVSGDLGNTRYSTLT